MNSENNLKEYIKIGSILLLSLMIIVVTFYSVILSWRIECNNSSGTFTIPIGSSSGEVAQILSDSLCVHNQFIFKLALRSTFKDRSVIPGRYVLKGVSRVGHLISMITSAPLGLKITFYEGWEIWQYAEALHQKLGLDKDRFIRLCNDHNFISSLNIQAPSLEGFLYPDTYILSSSYTEKDIIRIMVNQFKYIYKNIMNEIKISTVNLSMKEATTLASIIQGEAQVIDEMPMISSVYHNRLKKKMLLQADPTVQYVIPGKNRKLSLKDLKRDNIYNTYKYRGLPPGPINNPGKDAIMAALKPAKSKFYYFVADGTGRHIFSKTNREHNNNRIKIKRNRKNK